MWIVVALVLQFIIRLRFPVDKSIAHTITRRYGEPILHIIRRFEKVDFKRRKCALDILFLENCIKHDLIPKFIQFRVANRGLRSSKVYRECQQKLLNEELCVKKRHQKSLDKNYNQLGQQIRSSVSTLDFIHISSKFLLMNDIKINKIRLIQEKKLVNIGLHSASESNDPEKVIFNFSSRVLSKGEKSLLVKGLNLSIPPKKLNYSDFLLPFKRLFQQMDKDCSEQTNTRLDPVGATLKNAALDCFHAYDPKLEQNLTPDEFEGLKSLLQDENIIIQKSDKGNSVVVLNKSDYVERMHELLADTNKFRKLNIKEGKDYNFLINQELRISKVLRRLRDNGALSEAVYRHLNPTGTQPSVLYGLAKVHKALVNNIPKLRPILSAVNTPTYGLSQYLNSIMKPFTTNEYTTRDSFSFATDIRSKDATKYMASLDVDSLFTNIPLAETIDICCNLVFKDNEKVKDLTKAEFRELLTIATTDSFILFDGCFFQQIDGVAMGSPLGPNLANIFLRHHERKWLENCPSEFKPAYYRRYVDDIFLLFDNHDDLEKFKMYMNIQHPNMNFTSEAEENDALPFLDVFVQRIASGFVTSVYRKPTFSGVYTHFDSYIPSVYKSSLVSTLLYRSYTICSNWKQIDIEINNIKSFMVKNGFPSHHLDRLVSVFLNRIRSHDSSTNKAPSDSAKSYQVILPYLGNFSKRMENKIKQGIKQHMPNVKIKFIYRASTRLRTLFAFKDRLPSYLSSGIVYKYTCGRCNSAYIGETIRHAKTRFCEHIGISPLTGKPVANIHPSAITDHNKRCKSSLDFNDFVIIGRDLVSELNLQIKESLFIHQLRPRINIQSASIPLSLFKN